VVDDSFQLPVSSFQPKETELHWDLGTWNASLETGNWKLETDMSRIGKKPIAIPKGVKVDPQPGVVEIQGPKGKLRQPLPAGIGFEVEGDQLHARTLREDAELGKFHGLARSLVANAVRGVTEGFRKDLDIVGVGYRAEVKGKQVVFALGYSHPVVFDIPAGIDIAIDKQTHITVTGIDRQAVGQVAANIRRLRKPDPYKQKGVRYTGEVLKKKAGKTGAK
jgi:large subunit ribosomal protein L6